MNGVRAVRSWRIFNVVTLAFNLLLLTLNAVSGNILAVVNAAAVAILVAAVYVNTRTIHRIQERDRPRPDYAAIAAMERDIWGETFRHEGAPSLGISREATDRAVKAFGGITMAESGRGMTELGTVISSRSQMCPRHGQQRWEDRHTHPDTTQAATVDQYAAWLRGYVKRGGKPTHFYDYPFSRARFRYASSPLTVDSDYEYGARGRSIVIASGVLTERTNPAGAFGGWAHSHLYFMHGYRLNDRFVPVYSDPEFDAFRRGRGLAGDDDEHRSNLRWERPS